MKNKLLFTLCAFSLCGTISADKTIPTFRTEGFEKKAAKEFVFFCAVNEQGKRDTLRELEAKAVRAREKLVEEKSARLKDNIMAALKLGVQGLMGLGSGLLFLGGKGATSGRSSSHPIEISAASSKELAISFINGFGVLCVLGATAAGAWTAYGAIKTNKSHKERCASLEDKIHDYDALRQYLEQYGIAVNE
jgi:hypothetical protein